MSKITVIHHSADFDGLFCREIARKFLPTADLIGWDYGQPKPVIPPDVETIYILDLSPECLGGDTYDPAKLVWIDHHKSAIEKFPATIPGYRIDGVAACRLAWQWFSLHLGTPNPERFALPLKEHFVNRELHEPFAVQLAGEYDVWDKRNPAVDTFQLGLHAQELKDHHWAMLLSMDQASVFGESLLQKGAMIQDYVNRRDAEIIESSGFITEFEGLKFLALNSASKGSLQFAARDVPETGHDALMKFNFTGTCWDVSLYHAKHRTDLDLSVIAVRYGGGGHRGACGFRMDKITPITWWVCAKSK